MEPLNDFFAKKDKKKTDGLKYSTMKEIDRKIEEAYLKRDRVKKSNDPEWKEFEERKRDFTGLKIQNVEGDILEETDVENGEDLETACPWNVLNQDETDDNDINKQNNNNNKNNADGESIEGNVDSVCVNAYIPPYLRQKQVVNPIKNDTKHDLIDNKWPLLSSLHPRSKLEASDSSELNIKGKKTNFEGGKCKNNPTGDSNENNPTPRTKHSDTDNAAAPASTGGAKYIPPHLRAKKTPSGTENNKNKI